MADESGFNQDHESNFHEVKTRDQGISYLSELVGHVEKARTTMDETKLREAQLRAFHNLLIRYGRALGALTTLMHVRVLQNADYDRFAPRIHGAIVPRVIDTVQG